MEYPVEYMTPETIHKLAAKHADEMLVKYYGKDAKKHLLIDVALHDYWLGQYDAAITYIYKG